MSRLQTLINIIMLKFIIQYGISGGFNDADYYEVISVENLDKALDLAWTKSCEVYDMYVGTGGLLDIDEIMEEENCSYDEAVDIFNDLRESFIEYTAHEYSDELFLSIKEDYEIENNID